MALSNDSHTLNESINTDNVFIAMKHQKIYMDRKQRSLAIYYKLRIAMICYKLKDDKDQKTKDQIEEYKKEFEESFKLSNTFFKRWQGAFFSCFKDEKNITSLAIKNLSDHINKVLYLHTNAKSISLNIDFPELEEKMIPQKDPHIFFEKYLSNCNKIKHICCLLSIIDARRQIAFFKKYLVTHHIPNDSDKLHLESFDKDIIDANDTLIEANKVLRNLIFHNLNSFRYPNKIAIRSLEKISDTSDTSDTSITTEASNTNKDENSSSNRPLKMRKYNK